MQKQADSFSEKGRIDPSGRLPFEPLGKKHTFKVLCWGRRRCRGTKKNFAVEENEIESIESKKKTSHLGILHWGGFPKLRRLHCKSRLGKRAKNIRKTGRPKEEKSNPTWSGYKKPLIKQGGGKEISHPRKSNHNGKTVVIKVPSCCGRRTADGPQVNFGRKGKICLKKRDCAIARSRCKKRRNFHLFGVPLHTEQLKQGVPPFAQ